MSVAYAIWLRQWRSCRDAFEDYRENEYARAEEITNGVFLNRRGKAAGIDPYSLFIGSNVRAYAYASEELRAYWEDRPRMTFEAFERQWMEEPAL